MSKRLITGNEAVVEAAIVSRCGFYAGYPITPQNELIRQMAEKMREEKRIFIQAESELAAINMVFGAAATGMRAMTTSSSPGISLMQEGISYLCGCQLPAVIVNVMRGGPGLGNIAPSQADYFQATKGGGHGDYNLIVLAPSTVQEVFDLTCLAFDLADKYCNPVVILMDAFLGQMAEAVEIKKIKIKNYKKEWALTGAKARTPNVIRSLFLKEGGLEKHNLELQKKFKKMKKEVRFESINCKNAEVLFVAYGISFRIAKEAAPLLKEDIKAGVFRPITLWPFPYKELEELASGKKAIFVFELACEQLAEDVRLAVKNIPVYTYGRLGGGVFSEEELANFVKERLNEAKI